MNSLLLYHLSQCFGLSPFKYDKSTPRILESNRFSAINLIVGLFFCFLTISIQLYTVLTWLPERPKIVLLIVSYLEGIFLVIQNVLIFLIQFGNRKKLVTFINEGFDVTSQLKKVCPRESIFSIHVRKDLRSKIIWKSLQIVVLILTTLSFFIRNNTVKEWFLGFVFVAIYVCPMIISSIYYYGSVMISARFYEILNIKMLALTSNINKEYKLKPSPHLQPLCDISDEIDEIAVLYNRIASFVELINKHLSLQILIVQLYSFVLILSSVNAAIKFHIFNIR